MWSPLLESRSGYFVRGFIAYSFPWSRNFLESLFTVFVLWHGTLSQCDLQCCSKVWDFPVSIAFSWESLAMHILSDLLHTLSCSHYCGVPGNGSAVDNSILRYLVFIFFISIYSYIHFMMEHMHCSLKISCNAAVCCTTPDGAEIVVHEILESCCIIRECGITCFEWNIQCCHGWWCDRKWQSSAACLNK